MYVPLSFTSRSLLFHEDLPLNLPRFWAIACMHACLPVRVCVFSTSISLNLWSFAALNWLFTYFASGRFLSEASWRDPAGKNYCN